MATIEKQDAAEQKAPGDEKGCPVGPFLSTAVIAEAILAETDGKVSIIRIIDKVHIAPDIAASIKENVVTFPVVLSISFRGGGVSGEQELLVVQVNPLKNGRPPERNPIGLATFRFDGTPNERWEIKITPLSIYWAGFGRYWFDVYLGDKFCTRVPFEIAPPESPEEATP